jgi:signal transduction histidine kinase
MKNLSLLLLTLICLLVGGNVFSQNTETNNSKSGYQDTKEIVALVKAAADMISQTGEIAFGDFRQNGSRWRQEETYIFVLDLNGNMIVHSDPEMEGKNQIELKDVNGKLIIRGLLDAAMSSPDKPEGWYHYQWNVPGGITPRWKSSYVRMVVSPSGKSYVVGSGMYTDRMESEFVVDAVKNAVALIEKNGEGAFPQFYDPAGPYMAKDAYIFVISMNGVELVNPPFPALEGRNIMELKDTRGKYLVREMFEVLQKKGSGWVDYMWPKPGESVSTLKSTYVSKANLGDKWVMVGSGVYLADAPKTVAVTKTLTAPQLMKLVREAAVVFEKNGEKAFPDFRKQGSKWFSDDTYFFAWTLNGMRAFHAANPGGEGIMMNDVKDVHGRMWGKMFLDISNSSKGEGWVHYMYPEPGNIFPVWKSSFIKRVEFPSGEEYIIGSGIYNMQMDKAFIEDVVDHAVDLVKRSGRGAFTQIRDKTGPFVFMDTYVFVDDVEGNELVNPAQPAIEGKNIIGLKDINGKLVAKEYIDLAMKNGKGWIDYYWYRPGDNIPALKHTYVRKVEFHGETFIVGAGFYGDIPSKKSANIRKPL